MQACAACYRHADRCDHRQGAGPREAGTRSQSQWEKPDVLKNRKQPAIGSGLEPRGTGAGTSASLGNVDNAEALINIRLASGGGGGTDSNNGGSDGVLDPPSLLRQRRDTDTGDNGGRENFAGATTSHRRSDDDGGRGSGREEEYGKVGGNSGGGGESVRVAADG